MELNDLSGGITTRSRLRIDLNEIPSSSSSPPARGPGPGPAQPHQLDSLDLVCSFHENQDPASGIAAGLPGEVGMPACGACGKPEMREQVVVCDGCERGFHLSCAGMHGGQVVNLVDWICGECLSGGVKSKRWPLGVKIKRILDINSSPPSDCDGDGESSEERFNLRKHTQGGNCSSGNAFGAPLTYSNLLYAGNGFGSLDFKKGSGLMMKAFRVGFEDILHHAQNVDRSLEEIDLGFPLGGLRSSTNRAIRLPSRSSNEILLQALKGFISERHGILEEGWHVELKHSSSNYEVYAVYCSPDGKSFGSMSEVACYLGLTPTCSSMDADSDPQSSLQEKLHLPKKRKSRRFSPTNGIAEERQAFINGCQKELKSNGQSREIAYSKLGEVRDADKGDCCATPWSSDEGLPVQFEDFFVISLGKVDVRPSYHDTQLIWPVGYRSCWHDKVTGSLFVCEVLDGGDSGPLFKVRRFSCSVLPVPDGSTVLYRKSLSQFSGEKAYSDCYHIDSENDTSVEAILEEISPPTEDDVLTCLRHKSNEIFGVQTSESLQDRSSHSRPGNLSGCNLGLGDEIGEISAEEHSSTSAWRMVSQKLIDAYFEICSQKGIVKLCCKHVHNEIMSSTWDAEEKKSVACFHSLAKFSSSPISVGLPLEYHGEGSILAAVLSKWLHQDRFGLDAEFVQEIIEKLPNADACSKYESFINRVNNSVSLTVGNGLLISKRKNGAEYNDPFQRSKKAKMGKDNETDNCYPPPGRLLCSKFPAALVGNLYQVWELLWRFHEVLGFKEPFLLEKLEEELMNPWSDGSSSLTNLERKVLGNQVKNIEKVYDISTPILYKDVHGINSRVSVQFEKGVMNDSAQVRLASTDRRCSGVALTKIHSSLLAVLVSELQSKVAALVDPNFDSGESKLKRGRRKDVDNLIPLRRNKLTTLPINELTWPELARRYILAFLSMDGNLDFAEVTGRESGKVFRCLQGDGGLLCGSLSGVAGMEADALLLAEATKQIYGSLSREKDVLTIEDEVTDACGSCEKNSMNDGGIPEWAQLLEPVRKLPTNVGTRIRKCVFEALEKYPPEWARKRLEHSISKEVYKGNASGPTKKAVLSVLADVMKEGMPQKSDKRNKKKITIHVSDIIMKLCRIVLRRVAAADDGKVFCTLLGRNIVNSFDNDDEGLLGSPAMVSRPLDFRTIDLRLAVGAYGGGHESFLEDVQELWKNICTASRDQPDLVELAETLSENFENLFEKEVVPLVQRFEEYSKLEHLSVEQKKELDDILASTKEIPKAPWDDGVCKVCGVDKDDDSVLLCDTCDAEYHTYCLNPPLARIPEGNWYCPSCVGVNVIQGLPLSSQIVGQTRCKKYQGEVTRVYLEVLMHLTVAMGEKDYWDFRVDERTFLLKFLCDELLNSALVRQHLEQCMENTNELQQKLRSLSLEWKNLKSREEFLSLRATKMDPSASGEVRERLSSLANHSKSLEKPANMGDVSGTDVRQGHTCFNGIDQQSLAVDYEKKPISDIHIIKSVGMKGELEGLHCVKDDSNKHCQENSKSSNLPSLNNLPQVNDYEVGVCKGRDSSSVLPCSDNPGSSVSSDVNNDVENSTFVAANESLACHPELSAVKDDILHTQNMINSIESQLFKQSLRREFLGSDSRGRLYWASTTLDAHPRVVVDGSLLLQHREILDQRDQLYNGSVLQNSASFGIRTSLNLEGSRACFPFHPNNDMGVSSSWVAYETDGEIEELIGWLGDNDQKERELKDSIMQWLKLRSQDIQKTRNPPQEELETDSTRVMNSDKIEFSDCLITKAALFLEKQHGACVVSDTTDLLKKRGKKAKGLSEEKMYRCDCLELIWPSRYHCHSCHRTFSNDDEFEGHNDCKCSFIPPSHEKSKDTCDSSKSRGYLESEVARKQHIRESDKLRTSKSSGSELGCTRLIKFQNEGIECPYDFAEICTKFVTKDSNRELIEDIGLIGSNGIPSLLGSTTPYLSDSTLLLISPEKVACISDQFDGDESGVFQEGNECETSTRVQGLADNSSGKTAANEISLVLRSNESSLRSLQYRGKKSSVHNSFSEIGPDRYFVVPQCSLRPLVGKNLLILQQLKINLLDMEAGLPEEALRPSKGKLERRWAWHAFVKSAESIYQMVQATIMLEEMIKAEYLRNEWWYWSSLSAAGKISTVSSLALRIYSLDASIIYEKTLSDSNSSESLKHTVLNQKPSAGLDSADKCNVSKKLNKKRKEPEG